MNIILKLKVTQRNFHHMNLTWNEVDVNLVCSKWNSDQTVCVYILIWFMIYQNNAGASRKIENIVRFGKIELEKSSLNNESMGP